MRQSYEPQQIQSYILGNCFLLVTRFITLTKKYRVGLELLVIPEYNRSLRSEGDHSLFFMLAQLKE